MFLAGFSLWQLQFFFLHNDSCFIDCFWPRVWDCYTHSQTHLSWQTDPLLKWHCGLHCFSPVQSLYLETLIANVTECGERTLMGTRKVNEGKRTSNRMGGSYNRKQKHKWAYAEKVPHEDPTRRQPTARQGRGDHLSTPWWKPLETLLTFTTIGLWQYHPEYAWSWS